MDKNSRYVLVLSASITATVSPSVRADSTNEATARTNYVSTEKRHDSSAPAALAIMRELFNQLADEWEAETCHSSFPDDWFAHPHYEAILKMGRLALPLILERLVNKGGFWFHALTSITGENPIPFESRGNVPKMTAAWLEWASSREHTSDIQIA